MSQPLEWHTEQRQVNDLLPLEINPRKISEARRMKMIESLQRFNLVDIPVVDFDGTIISGHQRMRALQAIGRGEETIDVRMPNRQLTEKERKEYNVLANTHYGEFDEELFEEFFSDVDLAGLGLEEEDLFGAAIDEVEPVKLEAKEDDYEVPEVIVTDIVPGDLFEIGQHRLLCGDSTSADDVEKVMGGEKADMVFTDPPYGVDYSGGIQFTSEGVKKEQRSRLVNDDSERIYEGFIPLVPMMTSGPVYTWFAGTKAKTIYGVISEIGEIHALLIWVKSGGYGAINACYKQKHEPCLFWKPKGGRLNFVGDTTENTIWEIKKDGVNEFHPTQKPVALAARAIGNHSGEIIADPFLGSGTTMVAAHQLNRRCYGIEIDPKYCQIIVDRMLRLDPTLEVKRNGQPYQPKNP